MIFVDTLEDEIDYPDIQYFTLIFPSSDPNLPHFHHPLNLKSKVIDWMTNINIDTLLVGIYPIILRPKSRGRLMLNSPNPSDPPKLISGYLENDDDVKTLIRGIRFLKKFLDTKAFKNSTLYFAQVEECQKFGSDTDEFYECFIRNFGSTISHVCGTCKMGPSSDSNAVVDPTLKVHRVKGLRVADASIMPNIVSGNTNVPSIMIGEKGADLIKADWLKKGSNREEL